MRFSRLYLIPGIRERVAKARFFFFVNINTQRLNRSNDKTLIKLWDYSQSQFKEYKSIRERIDFLVSSLANTLRFTKNSRLLVLGPRYETEIFGYLGLGFRKQNVAAVDSFSYSKLVKVGNIHNLPFNEETFDVVMCGWTLAYSDDIRLAFQQIHKVLRPRGVLIFSFDLQEEGIPQSLIELRIPDHTSPLSNSFGGLFEIRNYFIGKTSWSSTNICCISLQKL